MELGDSDGDYCFVLLGPWSWEIQMGTIALDWVHGVGRFRWGLLLWIGYGLDDAKGGRLIWMRFHMWELLIRMKLYMYMQIDLIWMMIQMGTIDSGFGKLRWGLLLWIRPMELGDSDGDYCFGLGPWGWEI